MTDSKETSLECPRCGGEMMLIKNKYQCIDGACAFGVPATIVGRDISEETMREIFEIGRTEKPRSHSGDKGEVEEFYIVLDGLDSGELKMVSTDEIEGRGRPRIPEWKKKHSHTIRFTNMEWDKVQQKADELDITASEFVVKAALGKRIVPLADKELIKEIKRVGVNLNQIAKKFNQEGHLKNVETLKSYLDELNQLKQKVEHRL